MSLFINSKTETSLRQHQTDLRYNYPKFWKGLCCIHCSFLFLCMASSLLHLLVPLLVYKVGFDCTIFWPCIARTIKINRNLHVFNRWFLTGLPPDSSFICYELAIAYNISHLLLRVESNVVVGGCNKSAVILHKSLFRGTFLNCCKWWKLSFSFS